MSRRRLRSGADQGTNRPGARCRAMRRRSVLHATLGNTHRGEGSRSILHNAFCVGSLKTIPDPTAPRPPDLQPCHPAGERCRASAARVPHKQSSATLAGVMGHVLFFTTHSAREVSRRFQIQRRPGHAIFGTATQSQPTTTTNHHHLLRIPIPSAPTTSTTTTSSSGPSTQPSSRSGPIAADRGYENQVVKEPSPHLPAGVRKIFRKGLSAPWGSHGERCLHGSLAKDARRRSPGLREYAPDAGHPNLGPRHPSRPIPSRELPFSLNPPGRKYAL
jgi:hypothetical protein